MTATKNTTKRRASRRPDLRKLRPLLWPLYQKGGVNAVMRSAEEYGLTKLQAFDCCRLWVKQGV